MHLTTRARASRRALLHRGLGLLGIVAIAALLLAAATTRSQAFFNQDVIDAKLHFWQCFELMLTDPAAHAEQCGPNLIPPDLSTLVSSDKNGNGNPIVNSDPPPQAPPEVPECEGYECECREQEV